MQVSAASSQGLIQEIDFLCGTTSVSYPTNDKIRNINQAYHNVTRLIWDVADDWEYDDTNKSDLPIATTSLVHSQQDYELPSTAQRITRVEVLDSNSNYQLIKSLDKQDVNIALSEFRETDGMPQYYDLIGDSLFLYPAPSTANVVSAAGLRLHFDRNVTEFPVTASTEVPGFATQFHRILSYSAALDFEEDPNKRALLVRRKDSLEQGLKAFYGKRHREYRTRIKPRSMRYRRLYE